MTYDQEANNFLDDSGKICGHVSYRKPAPKGYRGRNYQVLGKLGLAPGPGIGFRWLSVGPPHKTHQEAVDYGLKHLRP